MDRMMARSHSKKEEELDAGERIDRLVRGARESVDTLERVWIPGDLGLASLFMKWAFGSGHRDLRPP